MKEIKSILSRYRELSSTHKKCALATVVHLEGSSYRRPGARMLIEEDGLLTGAISGGCLEGDALRKALYVIAQNKAMLVTYDTMDDDDAKFGVGLGCNGIIQVLIEPIDPGKALNPIHLLKEVAAKRTESILITAFNLQDRKAHQPGTCLLFRKGHEIMGDQNPLPKSLMDDIQYALLNKNSSFREYPITTGRITAFIEYIDLPVSLMIIGGGNDAFPLLEIANVLGWEPHIIDGRANYATQERFASACSIVVAKPEKVLEQINIDHRTAFVLMTHNYNYDLAMLRALLDIDIPYIGSLGPRKKLDRMINELKDKGMTISDAQMNKVFGPTGLDLGAETPEEIALSIAAEIQSVMAKSIPISLRDAGEFIHSREGLQITSSLNQDHLL